MTQTELLEMLQGWRAEGLLRRLDLAFARFMHAQDPQAPASLLLACALLAQLEGRGHSCLPVHEVATRGAAMLGWPAGADAQLQQALGDWPHEGAHAAAWGAGPLVEVEPTDRSGASPLVLQGGLLYLRRYWRYETDVAAGIRMRLRADEAEAADAANAADAADAASAPDGRVAPDAEAARDLLQRMFAPPPHEPVAGAASDLAGTAGVQWQKVACALALRRRWTIVTGGPGTGKTYTAARVMVLLHALHRGPSPLRMALAAPTGKAAARLRQAIDEALELLQMQIGAAWPLARMAEQLGAARTLHSLLGARPDTRRFRHDAANPLDLDVLFLDEASMVHLEMMAALLDALPAGARVVLLGDKDQLASVEAGAVMGELCGTDEAQPADAQAYRPETADWIRRFSGETLPEQELGPGSELAQQTIVLRESHRFAGPIGQLALAVNRGEGARALALLRADREGPVALVEADDAAVVAGLALAGRAGASGGYAHYLQAIAARPAAAEGFDAWARSVLQGFDRFRVLCALREGPWGVAGLNAAIETALAGRGLSRRGEWYEGRPVMVTRNDPGLGVFNGDIGVVLRAPAADSSLRCYFLDGERLRSVAVGRLADVETAFAMTVHKSQGSEFGHVVLVFPEADMPLLTRELVYTGITRAREAFTLVARDAATLAAAAGRRTRRVSGLRAMLARAS